MSSIHYLKSFAAVVEHGSFTAAALALNISKPVVSKQVTELERELGVQLMVRTTRTLHLTEAGETFAQYATKIIKDLQEAEHAVMPMQSEPQGTLVISAPQSLAYSFLPKILPQFQKRYPLIQLNVRITGRYVDLVEEGIDVAMRVGKMEDSSLMARLIQSCHMQVCAAPEYWRTHGKPQHPQELAQHNCLIYQPATHARNWVFTNPQNEDISVKVNGNLQSDDGGLLLSAAKSAQGVFYVPSFLISEDLKNGALEQALSGFSRKDTGLYALYPRAKHVPSKLRVFIDYLLEVLR
jgi:DNA-binding transcriptional LysR family regulator